MKASEALRICAQTETAEDNNDNGCLRITGMIRKYVVKDCLDAFPATLFDSNFSHDGFSERLSVLGFDSTGNPPERANYQHRFLG